MQQWGKEKRCGAAAGCPAVDERPPAVVGREFVQEDCPRDEAAIFQVRHRVWL